MRWLLMLGLSVLVQPLPRVPLDVSSLTIGAPVVVAELDLGKLKGEVRRLAWSPDGMQLYMSGQRMVRQAITRVSIGQRGRRFDVG